MMEYATTLDQGKTCVEGAELEDVGLSVGDVRNPKPLGHSGCVRQAGQAQIDCENLAVGINPSERNGLGAGSAASDEHGRRAGTDVSVLTRKQALRERFYRIGVGAWQRNPARVGI